jgi:hypothetical protein
VVGDSEQAAPALVEADGAEPDPVAPAVAVVVASLPGDPGPEPLGGYTKFPSSLHEYISGR